MKPFALICLFIVFTLNFVPCADAQEISQGQTELRKSSDNNHQDHHSNDTCSPFCNCSCCANSSIVKAILLSSIPFSEHQNTLTYYVEGNHFDVSLPVWQPPQLL